LQQTHNMNSHLFEPVYVRTHQEGILKEHSNMLREKLKCCTLCPRNCESDRLSGQTGICKTGEYAVVSSYMPHFGEERPLVGRHGSGTIFFTHCNLLCNFCQNYDISHEGRGYPVGDRELADMMLSLQALGCHNINFVTPTHVVPQIVSALILAIDDGLRVPLVYNSGGYDHVDTLKYLDGIVDIYMPDFKFWDPGIAKKICKAEDYPTTVKKAVKEMHNQVGDLVMDQSGIAQRGLLIRHLVMPEGQAGTKKVMEYISRELSPNSYVNVMPQYRPCGQAWSDPKLSRSITHVEFQDAVNDAIHAGITRLDKV